MNSKIISVAVLLVSVALFSGCGNQPSQIANLKNTEQSSSAELAFNGEEGETVNATDDAIELALNQFQDSTAQYYNTTLDSGKTVYFFVVMDANGVYRAAANACQVCHDSMLGFRQEGNFMICNTCGNKYPLEKIATEKGGCNPIPINPALETTAESVYVQISDIEQISEFF